MPFATLTSLGNESIFYALHRLRETGEAPAVVCVHGAGGNHLHWPPEIRRLPGATVYVLDLPGHGHSSGEGRRTVQEYASVLVSFLDTLNLPNVVLVGHSMGGAIAQQAAISFPERVRGLVLVGTGAKLRVTPIILEGILDDFAGVVQAIVDFAYGPAAPLDIKLLGQQAMLEVAPQVMRGDFLACDDFDIMAHLGEIAVPTLIITGTADRLTPAKYAQFLAQNIPNAQLLLVQDAGHMVMLEKAQEVGDAIARFVASL